MPKFYRFRPTSPTRRSKRNKDKEKDKENFKYFNRDTLETEENWLDMTLACPATPSWYLRRIAWRETPPLLGLSRQFNTGLRAELHIGSRPIFVFKVPPAIRSKDMMRLF